MKRLEKYLRDLKGMVDMFREEVDALADELATNGSSMTPEALHGKLCKLQERHRQAAIEKQAEFLEQATVMESDLQVKLQQVRAIKEQAEQTSSILLALTEAK